MDVRELAVQKKRELKGFLTVGTKYELKDAHDLSVAYTPGVAEPCLRIKDNEAESFELTCRSNMVAVVSDGTRVLGLGDIGAAAALPVMEGKSLLFKKFGDVDCIPLVVDTKDADTLINTVKLLQKNFAGINLEDISSPKCYEIENRLKEELEIPVFHDDQHGTAIACLAGVKGALRLVKKDLATAKIVVNGAGAAAIAISKLLIAYGFADITLCDRTGIIYEGREKGMNPVKEEMAKITNKKHLQGSLADAVRGADVFVGVSAPGVLTKEMVQTMAPQAIVFACANPTPEIDPKDAKAGGAAVVATGRSDYPNQINNVLAFPGIFRGTFDVHAKEINDEMKFAAATAIASIIPDDQIRADYIIPEAFNPVVAQTVAAAVAEAAKKSGVTREYKTL